MVKRNFSFLSLFSILTLLLIVLAIIVRVKAYAQKNSGEWKEYKNYDCSYQLSYPASWLIKASQYKNPCETNKEAKCIASQSVWIRNKNPSWLFIWRKRLLNRPPGDIGPPDITTFYLSCSQNNNYYSSIEDWVRRTWLSTNDDSSVEKETLEKIRELKFGNTTLSVFVASDTKMYQNQNRTNLTYITHSRLHFIYKDHIYQIESESGSLEQLKKDKQILDKMVQSIKIF
ncbi:MAG: hypothetical protein ABIJ03_02115 [Patescibacteria group bacterium]